MTGLILFHMLVTAFALIVNITAALALILQERVRPRKVGWLVLLATVLLATDATLLAIRAAKTS